MENAAVNNVQIIQNMQRPITSKWTFRNIYQKKDQKKTTMEWSLKRLTTKENLKRLKLFFKQQLKYRT